MLRLILDDKNMTLYRLEKESHISHATLSDLYNEKYNINKCSIELIYQLSKVLSMNINELYEILSYKNTKYITFNKEFDIFKSSVCQELKTLKEKEFLVKYIKNNDVRRYALTKDYLKAVYLVSIIDYLCKKNNLPLIREYDDVRKIKFDKLYVPESIFLLLSLNKMTVTEVFKESNQEFIKHNIAEAEVENVY